MSMSSVSVIYRKIAICVLLLLLCSCTSTAHNIEAKLQEGIKTNVARIGNIGETKLAYITKKEVTNSEYKNHRSQTQKTKSFGALKLSKSNNPEEDKIFFFQRKKGAYIAETKFHKKKNKSYFVSFGLDYEEKYPVFGFRLEF